MPAQNLWTIDPDGYLLTPSGAKAARVIASVLWLYDKRTGAELPFTLEDWWTVTQTPDAHTREVPFDDTAMCDNCGATGAFDFMGDCLCPHCLYAGENRSIKDFLRSCREVNSTSGHGQETGPSASG